MRVAAIGLPFLALFAVLSVASECPAAPSSYMGLYIDEYHSESCIAPGYLSAFTCWHWVRPNCDGTICAEYAIDLPENCFYVEGTPNPDYSASGSSGSPPTGVSICMNECQTDWFWTYRMGILQGFNPVSGTITLLPHPDNVTLQTTSCADGNPVEQSELWTNIWINDICPPRLTDVEVVSPTCLKAYFDQTGAVYTLGDTYNDNFRLYNPEIPCAPLEIAAVTRLPVGSDIYFGIFLIYLDSPMETGTTYTLEAHLYATWGTHTFSTEDVTFGGGFTDNPDLAITSMFDCDAIAQHGCSRTLGNCPIEFDLRLLNAGTVDAGPFSVAISIGDYGVPGSETIAETLSYNGLAAGQFIYENVSFEPPEGFLKGVHSIIIKTDSYEEIGEWTEDNNEYSSCFVYLKYYGEIVSIADVPGDSGGWVEMVFNKSDLDFAEWRNELYSILRLNKSTGEWIKVAEISAIESPTYVVSLPTDADSSGSTEDYWSVYRVVYERPLYDRYYTSCPDSGYSIDNLGLITDAVSVPTMPLTLDQNEPNPFNPSTFISFHLPEARNVCLEIFDVSGRRVRMLENGIRPSGRHRIEWNGLDDSGSSCSSGVYFYRLKAGKEILSRKMVLMR